MALVQVPGFNNNYVVDTSSGNIQRVGRTGGLRDPISNQLGGSVNVNDPRTAPEVRAAIQGMFSSFGGGGGGGGFEMPEFNFPEFQQTPEEKELLKLQIDQIKESNRVQQEILGRENARRAAYSRFLSGERWTAANMEEDQGQLAAQAGKISRIEQDRLEKALEGSLPVSPSTERTIREGRSVLEERLRRNLGTDYPVTESGGKELARADESAAILKEADQKGYIERGIQPAVTAGQFSQDMIGQYVPTDLPGMSDALRGLRADRQAAQNYATAQGQYALGLGQIGLGEDQLSGQNMRFAAQQASDYINSRRSSGGSGGGFFGSGLGKFVGSMSGPAAAYLIYGEGKRGSSSSNAYSSGQGFG